MDSKAGYEPIPDVEKGEATGTTLSEKEKYPDLDDQQLQLLTSLDTAIASSQLDLKVPKVSPDDLAAQGQGYLKGLIMPTVTAAGTFCMAAYLGASARATENTNSVNQLLMDLFPYLNATLVFFSSISPIQKRFMAAVAPMFAKSNQLQQQVQDVVSQIAPKVDATVDSIHEQVRQVIKPMKPTLDKASAQESALKKMDPDIDIPDASDVDREFDEAKGEVGERVAEAEKHLDLGQYIPNYLQSANSFYWTIIFPVILAALLIQLGIAFLTSYRASSSQASRLLASTLDVNVPNVDVSNVDVPNMNVTEYKDMASDKRNEYEEQFDQYRDQFDAAMANSKELVMNVIWSYAIALLQLGFVYLVTNEAIKAWIMNKAAEKVTEGAIRTLREYGAAGAAEDVMGTKMSRVRQKMLKLIRSYQKMEGLVTKVSGTTPRIPEGLKAAKKPSVFGRLIGKK